MNKSLPVIDRANMTEAELKASCKDEMKRIQQELAEAIGVLKAEQGLNNDNA